MKRSVVTILALGLALLAISCGGKAAKPADTAGLPTARLLTDATGIDDKSFNAAAWRGILDFYGDTWENQAKKGKSYDVVTAQTQDMYVPNLKQASDEKYDLVVVTGFTWADALGEVAKQYPDQKYMIVDVDWVAGSNVMQMTFSEHEGSYLVGVAAALKAQADGIKDAKFGFIGGIPGPVITKFEMGWVQGIKSVLPDAKIVDYYANDWGKPELAKAQAKEYRSQGKNVWAIGVDSDQFADGVYAEGKSAVLTSMMKRVDVAAHDVAVLAKNGQFPGGQVLVFNVKNDGVGLPAQNPNLGDDIMAKVKEYAEQIKAGTLVVAEAPAKK